MTEWSIGVILYLLVVAGILRFFDYLKKRDEAADRMFKNHLRKKGEKHHAA